MLSDTERKKIEKKRRIDEQVRLIKSAALEQDEERIKLFAEKDREDLVAFNDEERTLAIDPDATSTISGRMIRRHGSKNNYSGSTFHKKEIDDAIRKGIITASILNAVVSSMTPLAGSFKEQASHSSKNATQAVKYEDENYVYDTTRVDAETKARLDRESAIIETRIQEMQAVSDPIMREKMALAIIELAEDFEMRPHPVTQRYVHSIDRVERELKSRRVLSQDCHGEVCVFRVKLEIGDVRGVKRVVGDQFNQDPQETIATGDHLKVEAAASPIPPPQFNHS